MSGLEVVFIVFADDLLIGEAGVGGGSVVMLAWIE